ncbi:MAG: 1-deoxy-D-xylulose-5-phosphate synthase [bacterium]
MSESRKSTDYKRGLDLLEKVEEPEHLRRFSEDDLPDLAEGIRHAILSAICETGGHLASSLGVVELTVALHYVFNTPADRLIWDVGHQTYPHKILTGRKEEFPTVRCYGGISGFPKREESSYDAFGTGHASTSISAAMGMAYAFQMAGKKDQVVAVIGDGGLTGGMALEALNQSDSNLSNLTVILNDNEMSIAPSVGRLSTFLSRSVISRHSFKINELLRRAFSPLPKWLFEELRYLGKRWRQSFLAFWTPGTLFEGMGYHYIGPVDGHRTELLIPALRQARDTEAPVLVHVLTTKGKGYPFAEEEPSAFHGIGPFNLETGEKVKKKAPPSYTRVFADTMIELFSEHPDLVGITAAMPQGTGLDKVQKQFPGRVFDMGITEQHCVTFAAGMACEGYHPVVAIYSTFLQRAYDQILHDVCLQELPLIFCLDRAGIVGEDGPTHHGLFDLSYLRSMPGMTIMCPSDENELRNMLATAATSINGPAAIRYPRGAGTGTELDESCEPLPIGRGRLVQPGRDLLIIAAGTVLSAACEAAHLLAKEGTNPALMDARFVKPLDRELITEWAGKTRAVVTVEENTLAGGFGAAVLELLQEAGLEVPVHRIGIPDRFVEHGPPELLREDCGLDPEGIARQCREFIKRTRRTHAAAVSS